MVDLPSSFVELVVLMVLLVLHVLLVYEAAKRDTLTHFFSGHGMEVRATCPRPETPWNVTTVSYCGCLSFINDT